MSRRARALSILLALVTGTRAFSKQAPKMKPLFQCTDQDTAGLSADFTVYDDLTATLALTDKALGVRATCALKKRRARVRSRASVPSIEFIFVKAERCTPDNEAVARLADRLTRLIFFSVALKSDAKLGSYARTQWLPNVPLSPCRATQRLDASALRRRVEHP